jgi:hypothetical protein
MPPKATEVQGPIRMTSHGRVRNAAQPNSTTNPRLPNPQHVKSGVTNIICPAKTALVGIRRIWYQVSDLQSLRRTHPPPAAMDHIPPPPRRGLTLVLTVGLATGSAGDGRGAAVRLAASTTCNVVCVVVGGRGEKKRSVGRSRFFVADF